ncbi:hypothetical protein ACN6Q6_10385, partial [Acinetobacter baumannii]
MLPPVPKTKSSEVTDIINSAVLTGSISEFQYFRCKRLLNDIKETEPLDWFLLSNSIIEMYFDNPILLSLIHISEPTRHNIACGLAGCGCIKGG